MFRHLTFAHYLLMGGLALGAVGFVLWWQLPMGQTLPPFIVTSVLAMAWGIYEWVRNKSAPPGS